MRLLVLIGLLGALFALRDQPRLQFAAVFFMLLTAPFVPEGSDVRYATRSFFGSLRVMEAEAGAVRYFLHGTTNHGAERMRDASGAPVNRPVPAQYQHPAGPLARSLDVARAATGRPRVTSSPASSGSASEPWPATSAPARRGASTR